MARRPVAGYIGGDDGDDVMRYFPMFLDMAGRDVLIAGGGEQAAQKARLLSRTEARLMLMAPALCDELSSLVAAGGARHVAADFDGVSIARARYAFIATGDEALDDRIGAAARSVGALVNMIDRPEACDMITPALVDRDPVVVAIGTEGAAPVLARSIRAMVERALSPRLGPFAAMLGALRPAVAAGVPPAARLRFWDWALSGAPWSRWLEGDEAGAAAEIEAAAASGGAPGEAPPLLSLLEIPESPDLLSLRAASRLQAAALILHPVGVAQSLLDLARRDAARAPVAAFPSDVEGLDALRAASGASSGPVAILAPTARLAALEAALASAETIRAGGG